MTVEERLKVVLGELMIANQANLAKIDELEKKLKDLYEAQHPKAE